MEELVPIAEGLLFLVGDEGITEELMAKSLEISEEAAQQLLYDEYTEKLITARNATMTEYAENALLSGKEVFLCVGAAHIIGEGAIAENLRQLGYTVELVS